MILGNFQFVKTGRFLAAIFFIAISCHDSIRLSEVTLQNARHTVPFAKAPIAVDASDVLLFFQLHPYFWTWKDTVLDFYVERSFRFAWSDQNGPNKYSDELIRLLDDAELDGIRLDSTLISPLKWSGANRWMGDGCFWVEMEQLRFVDILRTVVYFDVASRLYRGVGQDKARDFGWFLPFKKVSLKDRLMNIFKMTPVNLSANEPLSHAYLDMRRMLSRLRRSLDSESWPKIEFDLENSKTNDDYEIRHRLCVLGDLDSSNSEESLRRAIVSFRKRYGLKSSVGIDAEFLQLLNIPLDTLIQQVLVNMERLRWLPEFSEDKFIVVNVPAFTLIAYQEGKIAWMDRVVVGQPTWPTTLFSSKLTSMVFDPAWDVPKKIFLEELLPEVLRDTGYLARNHFQVINACGRSDKIALVNVDWRRVNEMYYPVNIRQTPGSWNALGRVKFLLPNPYAIYLHDTPARQLFNSADRTLSHGCVRVEHPEKLVEFLVPEHVEWSSRIRKGKHKGVSQNIGLDQPVRVYIVYLTAWVDDDKQLNFRRDCYGLDRRMSENLCKLQ